MLDIKLEPDDLEICRGCLSSDRRLSSVTTDDFRPLLTEDQSLEMDHQASITLCWECLALLHKTRKFQRQVQKAHTILQDSLLLSPAKPTLSSLSVHQHFEYDAIFEESTPTELPISYETPEHHKVIVPTKYKTKGTKSSIENENTDKVVLNDIYGDVKCNNDIKIEHPDDDSDADVDQYLESDDRNLNSSEEITETKMRPRKSLRKAANNSEVKHLNQQNTQNLRKESSKMKTPAMLKKVIVRKQKTPKKRITNSIKKCSDEIEIGTINNIDNNKKVENDLSDAGSQDAAVASKRKKHLKQAEDPDFNVDTKKGISSNDNDTLIGIQENKGDHKEKPIKKKERSKLTKKLKYNKIFTKYKKIEHVLQYFQEIEMSQQDLKSTLEKDDAIVDDKYPVKCTICGMMLMFARSLDAHAYRYHRKTLPDLIVNKRFIYPPLQLPQKSVWRCCACSRMMRKEHIVAHMNRYHSMQYYCIEAGCELYQKDKKYFWEKEHCIQHWDEVHKQCICDICNKWLRKKTSMAVHIMESHRPARAPKPLQCPYCSKTFTTRSTLHFHKKKHMVEPAELRYCVECDTTFKNVFTFKAHFRTFHSGKPRAKLPCTVCGKVMKSRHSLKLHMNYFHIGVTKYRCNICGKYLFNPHCLKQHLDKHNNIKSKKPKTIPCTVCGRTFQYKTSLQVHMHTHTGERPYKCPHCEAAFTQPFVLRTHLAKQHNVNAAVRLNGDIIPVKKTD
ncbi:zinc finger protein 614-like isoform X2 [Cydia pomonella]|uniref:zinc finger protein 614-like isoform X2 n=1 Tax=Cydia pomonella TaxID=82600 RepID=UPI002ADDD01C|nr:zinc finger protein 614-like isoform X2 [Cydia pomonella]